MNEWYESVNEWYKKHSDLLLFISEVAVWSLLTFVALLYDAKYDSCGDKNKHGMVSMTGAVLDIYGDEFGLVFYFVSSVKGDDGNTKEVNVHCTHKEYLSLRSDGFKGKYITFYYDEDSLCKYHTGAFSE